MFVKNFSSFTRNPSKQNTSETEVKQSKKSNTGINLALIFLCSKSM